MNATLLAVGDNVVDRYPDRGICFPGGNAVNVAVHARRCGMPAAYIGAVGTDPAGQVVLDALRAERVDTSLVRVLDGRTAYAEVRVMKGNRVFTDGEIGVSRFQLSPSDLAAARTATIVHTGECSMLEDQLLELKDASRCLSFDFSERPDDYVHQYAPLADIAIRSRPDATIEQALVDARRLQSLGPDTVAVTVGARGAVVIIGDQVGHAPASAVTVVDTLGAGDAFIARFLTGLAADEPLDTLIGAATTYASQACTSLGAFGYETPLPDQSPPDRSLPDRSLPLPLIHEGVDLS